MSYDIRFAVKAENGQYVNFAWPEYGNPIYNTGKMLRAAMDWDFKQGEYYRFSEIKCKIVRGYGELITNRKAYKKYEPDNGFGSVGYAREVLNSILEKIAAIEDEYGIPQEYVYMAW